MSTSALLLISASFFASAVEVVEAITIVLAVGITRGWRTALIGAGTALVALVVLVATLGPTLVALSDNIHFLQILVGVLLLIFGMQWLRKAILRSAGLRELHDEERIFQAEVSHLSPVGTARTGAAVDWTGFVVSFKGVFLEGLEVAFIVLTFGASSGRFDLSAAGAVAALVLVSLVGVVLHRPLSRVPENSIKFAVGVLLMAFGTYWGGEGVGVEWALHETTIVLLAVLYGVVGGVLIRMLRRDASVDQAPAERVV